MLTQAPLPSWPHLLRSLFRRSLSGAALGEPWVRKGETSGWLSRSAWSIALIALWRKASLGLSPVIVWVPDYFCNEALAPLREAGAKLVFYPLSSSLTPDLKACKVMAGKSPPHLFILVHYFGRPTPAAPARDFCRRHGSWLIEDAAHVLRPVPGVGVYGDFVLYSPHKHLPLPDGAALVARADGPGELGALGIKSLGSPEEWSGQVREQLGTRRRVLGVRAYSYQWLGKRLLQKLGVRAIRRSRVPFGEQLRDGRDGLLAESGPTHSPLSRRLLTVMASDLETAGRWRRRYEQLWDAAQLPRYSASSGVKPAWARSSGIGGWTPYLAAFSAEENTAEGTFKRWQRNGLPVMTWPDLPPEVTANPEAHARAWSLRHSMLFLPVHHSLNARQILGLPRRPSKLASGSGLQLRWNSANREQWARWMIERGRSSLLQGWAYGEAKAMRKGWRVRRGVFYRGNDPIAIVQVLEKRFGLFLKVSRVSRGPLSVADVSQNEWRVIWGELARLGCTWKGRLLSIAPESTTSGSMLPLLAEMGYRQMVPKPWESAWVDLSLGEDTLRARLDGKWRNMLVSAEKAGLGVEVGSDDHLFDWMVDRYRSSMLEKDFEGPPVSLLVALRECADPQDLQVFRAMREGRPVAGICLARHGNAATYLLGWNGDEGRRYRANHYLLWEAIRRLPGSDTAWLDLGGLDEENTPGITSFKMGLNGERYELIGEYWKW
jgi:hypothetical protein